MPHIHISNNLREPQREPTRMIAENLETNEIRISKNPAVTTAKLHWTQPRARKIDLFRISERNPRRIRRKHPSIRISQECQGEGGKKNESRHQSRKDDEMMPFGIWFGAEYTQPAAMCVSASGECCRAASS